MLPGIHGELGNIALHLLKGRYNIIHIFLTAQEKVMRDHQAALTSHIFRDRRFAVQT